MDSRDELAQRRRQRTQEIADNVLDYLRECPDAMDSVEGIAEWWIGRAQLRTDVTLLAQALDQLTTENILEQVGDGERRRYRLRPGAQF